MVHTTCPVHPYSPVPTPRHTPIFTYGSSDPPSPSHDLTSSPTSVTLKGNPTPWNSPPNTVPNVPADTDSYPNSSDYSFLESPDSPDSGYTKRGQCKKNIPQSKKCFNESDKKCAKLTSKILKAV